jgi:hypothetical protein
MQKLFDLSFWTHYLDECVADLCGNPSRAWRSASRLLRLEQLDSRNMLSVIEALSSDNYKTQEPTCHNQLLLNQLLLFE